jgi:hypothetical protein
MRKKAMSKKTLSPTFALLPYKNLAVALLFSLFFGPLGLLYASMRGGIIMVFIAFVVICNRFPVPIVIMWISCCIWSVMATNRYNNKIMEARVQINHEEKNCSSTTAHG